MSLPNQTNDAPQSRSWQVLRRRLRRRQGRTKAGLEHR